MANNTIDSNWEGTVINNNITKRWNTITEISLKDY